LIFISSSKGLKVQGKIDSARLGGGDFKFLKTANLNVLSSIYHRSLETQINLLYSISLDRKHCFGIEKKQINRFTMVFFLLGRYRTNQLISLSEFPVIYVFTIEATNELFRPFPFPHLSLSIFLLFPAAFGIGIWRGFVNRLTRKEDYQQWPTPPHTLPSAHPLGLTSHIT
jgi:hypothetical protein